MSKLSDRRDGIRNVNDRYYAAVNSYYVPITLEHAVTKQPQNYLFANQLVS